MKVFLTGGTGFVGAYTARELVASGHDVRLLVRDVAFARCYFAELGCPVDDFVVGDMCDANAIKQALEGCEAVVHAAAMVSLDSSHSQQVYDSNTSSISTVIETALDTGIRNILWVSSGTVFFASNVQAVDESAPLGDPHEAYARSKVDCEKRVRELQKQGAPIQITYPSGIIGPDDPRLSESNRALRGFLDFIPNTSSGLQHVDVRDLAEFHRFLLEHPPQTDFEEARYIFAGHYLTWSEMHGTLERLTGRQIPHPRLPGWLLRVAGKIIDTVKRFRPLRTQISGEAMQLATRYPVANSDRALAHAQMAFRPVEESFRDALRWQVSAGHIKSALVGELNET
jgi:nucleoside-diphosphate-sugar epimerase